MTKSTPLVMVESPLEVHAVLDPRTRKVRAAVKRWYDDEAAPGSSSQVATHATQYLPNETIWYTSKDGGSSWTETDRDEHGMGEVPVVPLVNRPRTAAAARSRSPWAVRNSPA